MINTLNRVGSCSILELYAKGRCKIVNFTTVCVLENIKLKTIKML